MNRIIKSIYKTSIQFGFDPLQLFNAVRGIPFYIRDLKKLKQQKGYDESFRFGRKYPLLTDRFSESGTMKGHYFHQDLYVAKRIFKANPKRHVDIGSRTDGFVAHVAVFREIEIMDIRDQKSKVPNVLFTKADLMKIPENMVNYCDSISALHSIEHFGLGRYGDPVDYLGHLKAIENISLMLQTGGVFYFAVPIGSQRIEFNAHRVFSMPFLLDLLGDKFNIESFSYVNDMGNFFENVELSEKEIATNFNCYYGCGIFVLKKK
jgi:SAM-dependent methyltransferase